MNKKGNFAPNQYRAMDILRQAVENTNEAFVTIDQGHRVVFFNRAAERIFGYSRDDVIGRDLNYIMSPECSKNHKEAVTRYVKTRIPGRIGHETELTATKKGGAAFPVSISFSVTELDGRLFFTGIVRDLTENKVLQDQIKRSEQLAALGQLVAEITHEIKNPLVTIGGFARQISRTVKDKKNIEKLNIVSKEVMRLEKLLSELREFYVPKGIASEKVDISGLLKELYSMVSQDIKNKGIKASLHVDKKASLVKGDRERLKQVFLNLVKNSIDAVQRGGKIDINTEKSGRNVIIKVSDNGYGIPDKNKEKIFSPFFTTKEQGTGLGLGISKGIVKGHKGADFEFESSEGRGTSFKITLPAFEE